MTPLFGQAWLTARGLTGGLLLVSVALVFVGVMLFTARAFWHWPVSTRPGYYQLERGLVASGFVALALGLAGLGGLLRQAGDPVFADLGLAAGMLGAGLLILTELTWLAKAGLPDGLTLAPARSAGVGAWLRMAVVLLFVAQVAYGAALLQTGLLPGWLGWLIVLWNLGWLAVLGRAKDPYYPVLHFVLPLLAGVLLLAHR